MHVINVVRVVRGTMYMARRRTNTILPVRRFTTLGGDPTPDSEQLKTLMCLIGLSTIAIVLTSEKCE